MHWTCKFMERGRPRPLRAERPRSIIAFHNSACLISGLSRLKSGFKRVVLTLSCWQPRQTRIGNARKGKNKTSSSYSFLRLSFWPIAQFAGWNPSQSPINKGLIRCQASLGIEKILQWYYVYISHIIFHMPRQGFSPPWRRRSPRCFSWFILTE